MCNIIEKRVLFPGSYSVFFGTALQRQAHYLQCNNKTALCYIIIMTILLQVEFFGSTKSEGY